MDLIKHHLEGRKRVERERSSVLLALVPVNEKKSEFLKHHKERRKMKERRDKKER
jgi:hypothetical protein